MRGFPHSCLLTCLSSIRKGWGGVGEGGPESFLGFWGEGEKLRVVVSSPGDNQPMAGLVPQRISSELPDRQPADWF